MEKAWKRAGLDCRVVFVRQSHRCGYVGVPKKHRAYNKSEDTLRVDVHGGVTYAGYDDDAIYFSLSTLKKRLRDRDIRPSDQQLMHTLKDLGWDTRRQTFGERRPRVWYKALVEASGNGNGNGNGHGHDDGGLFPSS